MLGTLTVSSVEWAWAHDLSSFFHPLIHILQGKIREAYQRLYQKPANYELPDEDVRQLMYDLESSYNMFLAALKSGRSWSSNATVSFNIVRKQENMCDAHMHHTQNNSARTREYMLDTNIRVRSFTGPPHNQIKTQPPQVRLVHTRGKH
jgi:hypothetical protein